MKVAGLALVALLLFLGLSTWWALESSGVAVIETRAADGSLRATHVWYAEPDGELWLEAGTPTNPWYRDVLREPSLLFSADERSGRYLARRVEEPFGHERIRKLLRKKYGYRDWWIGMLFDTSGSLAVRLTPEDRG